MSRLPKGTLASRAKANTTRRQALKTKWDRHCKYEAGDDMADLPKSFALDGTLFSAENVDSKSENWCRLLDEGVVVDNDFFTGEPYAYAVIEKSVIKKWYDTLPDNFVGRIDKDHNISIGLGTFTKKDLRLVETENGRYAVDVNVQLDHELYAVKDLLRENNRTALSVEMFVNAEEYAVASKVTGNKNDTYLVPLISELKIEGYAVCIAPKSANSYKDDLLEKASVNTNVTEESNMEDDEAKKTLEVEAEAETETAEDASEEVKDTEESAEESKGEDAEVETDAEDAETEADADEADADEDGAETSDKDGEDKLTAVEKTIEQLKSEIANLKEENADLKTKLSAKTQEKENFEERLTNILSMAASDEPSADEGGATPEDKQTKKDEEVDAYAEAFANLNKE